MKPTLRQIEEREKQKKEKRQIDTLIKYDRAKICPKCCLLYTSDAADE